MHLTESEKAIYNTFLATGRSIQNKPFTIRKDFSKIDDKTYILLKKLSLFFSKYTHIKYNDFFAAPYNYYGKDNYFDLQYFTTIKAIKCYTLYQKQKETEQPDSENIINSCKESCSFIYKYCRDHNLTLDEYRHYIVGTIPIILQHLKDHKINFYTIQGLNCDRTIRRVERDILNFIVEDFDTLLNNTRINFQKSNSLKNIVRKAFAIIEEKLLQNKKQTIQ
jgi:hypothetical protein